MLAFLAITSARKAKGLDMNNPTQTIIKAMTDAHIEKNTKLLLEFNKYAAQHLEIYDQFPYGCVLVMTSKNDKEFSEYTLGLARKYEAGLPIVKAQKSGSSWRLQVLEPVKPRLITLQHYKRWCNFSYCHPPYALAKLKLTLISLKVEGTMRESNKRKTEYKRAAAKRESWHEYSWQT